MMNPRLWIIAGLALLASSTLRVASGTDAHRGGDGWIGTWAAAAQATRPMSAQTFRNQTVRLVVRASAGGKKIRITLSNAFGDRPLIIGSARAARRTTAADIDPSSDRALRFGGYSSTVLPPGSKVVSDPVDLDLPPLSDLAISLFFSQTAVATTSHSLALQTNYVSAEIGDVTDAANFPVTRTIASWPFLTGVDVGGSVDGATIVAFGDSTTDGDGSTRDANRRWPDILAERLQNDSGRPAALGVLNEGIIGNRLLSDSPRHGDNPFGPLFGQAGVTRFQRDVLAQSGVKHVIVSLGVNDILFPALPFTPPTELVTAADLIAGYRRLIARAGKGGIRVIGTTIPPFEGARFLSAGFDVGLYTPERERLRQSVNAWMRDGGEFVAVVDRDRILRDPTRPTRLHPAYDAGDHLHVNDAGNAAQANAIPLSLFRNR